MPTDSDVGTMGLAVCDGSRPTPANASGGATGARRRRNLRLVNDSAPIRCRGRAPVRPGLVGRQGGSDGDRIGRRTVRLQGDRRWS